MTCNRKEKRYKTNGFKVQRKTSSSKMGVVTCSLPKRICTHIRSLPFAHNHSHIDNVTRTHTRMHRCKADECHNKNKLQSKQINLLAETSSSESFVAFFPLRFCPSLLRLTPLSLLTPSPLSRQFSLVLRVPLGTAAVNNKYKC